MRRAILNHKGQVLVLVALMLMVLVGMAAFALDVGIAYGIRARLNAAVDAAAIAALRERTSTSGTDVSAGMVAQQYLNANFPSSKFGIPPPTCNVTVALRDGAYVASVHATSVVPTYFAKMVGMNGLTVAAKAEATRPGMDVALVMDTTSSLFYSFPVVQTQATNFVNKFSEANDRIALIPFATGVGLTTSGSELVLTEGVEMRKTSRGFDHVAFGTALSRLSDDVSNPIASGYFTYTNSEFGLRMGLYELEKVARPGSRAIVLFSDGAPNTFTGVFPLVGGTSVNGSLFSGTFGTYAKKIYSADKTYQAPPADRDLLQVPGMGGGNTIGGIQILPTLPVTSRQRPLTFFHDVSDPIGQKCDANIAARNLMENVADYIRSRGIVIHTIGFGTNLDQPDLADCTTAAELGSTIMRRVANSKDSDTYNANQPTGLFCRAETAAQLGPCFDAIANALLRLSK